MTTLWHNQAYLKGHYEDHSVEDLRTPMCISISGSANQKAFKLITQCIMLNNSKNIYKYAHLISRVWAGSLLFKFIHARPICSSVQLPDTEFGGPHLASLEILL